VAGSIWAIVVAAGKGTRYGGPKQFALVGGRTVVELAVDAIAQTAAGGIVVVIPADLLADEPDGEASLLASIGVDPLQWAGSAPGLELLLVAGRVTRAGSVRAGLEAVPEDCEVVLVHDAARPLASSQLCLRVAEAVRAGADGAIPGIAIADTVKRTSGNEVVETLERASLVRVQTPQAFRADVLRRAHSGDPEATDDAGLVEALGGRIVVVPGEDTNVKITSPTDLALVEWLYGGLVAQREQTPAVESSR
jgi:2-C-methyl-D-erythritol 4-phosphate cytidylyltransferase